ncbi:YdeI/OmpD-associated family protein [Pyxidicoccus xibeiensis]|uniref:YdeI/OmpD-associated family protein n=1 Tax=Pyxidicoccus xibeiensis TaxID=2906759 RepID=UPI0020A72C90|nr:YdeI/OmpD-associated family protein [Pyxidicoccus xibeiensis]MCP3142291.1 YdeI/OmpD-associated family protein [Pyxidicoccus xibeiensis]
MSPAKKTVVKKAPAKNAVAKAPAVELPILPFESPKAWETWLAKHHASSRGVWLKLGKKGTGIASVTYPEALDVALAWGWIDGQKGSFDDAWWLQKFTPRGARSVWSKINRDKVAALIAAGKMQPPGLAVVESAKQDGRWDAAYDSPSKVVVPDDLKAALDANPRAAAYFATLNSANRYAILWRVHTAKKAETRARRIAQFVEMLARHESLHA